MTVEAMDRAGNRAEARITDINIDKTPPSIGLELTPDRLWPADHRLKTITATVTVEDSTSPSVFVTLHDILSSESDGGSGDGRTTDDIQGAAIGTEDYSFMLRAERSGTDQTDRRYTVVYRAEDLAGNAAETTEVVTVPHNRRDRSGRSEE